MGAFFGTPGLTLRGTAGNGPVRGLRAVNGLLYVVSGTGVYVVTPNFNVTQLGTIATGSGQVSIIDNGTQVAIFDGVAGYCVTIATGVVSTIALPFPNPGTAVYQDGFGLVNQLNSQYFWQSNLFDFTTWNALNYAQESASSSNIVALGELHRQVYVFKSTGTFVYINAGLSGFAFQRLDGVSLDVGTVAPNSVCKCGEALLWLGVNEQGQGVVYEATGYQPQRRSTHAIEHTLAGYPTITDAIAYAYQQEGHYFYQLTFPAGNETWVLDLTATRMMGVPAWHQRAAFSNGQFSRHQTATQAFFAGFTIVGDIQTGNLYSYDLDNYTDNGATRKWLRSWRARDKVSEHVGRVNYLEIKAQTGVTQTPNANPQMVLRQSYDAYSWSPEIFSPVGSTGATGQRIKFNRLGAERRGLGEDRIFELSSTDAFKVALLEAVIG